MQSNPHRILAMAPRGRDSLALVVASWRAGGIGIVDGLQMGLTAEMSRKLDGFGVGSYAIRLRADQIAGEDFAGAGQPANLVVCAVPWNGDVLARACDCIHASGRTVVCEVVSVEEADAALAAGADGLIAVGNEAGGWVGSETTFILLQGILALTDRPVWARGGIGTRSAAGCLAAGAAGVVLDGALLLAREADLPDEARRRLSAWDGSEPFLIRSSDGAAVRVYAPRSSTALARLTKAAGLGREAFFEAVEKDVGWGPDQVWPAGQDAALAADLANRHVTVGGIVQAVSRAMDLGLATATQQKPLAQDAPLARRHRCRFPILQGPMTRVSDLAPFAEAIAREGGLPFVALALLRRSQVERLLEETARLLDGRSWGVGLIGFAPAELRQEQIAAVQAARPPFALIAGGRPDQAAELESHGITTYLHVPSPGLLDQFLRAGARRFVLEGHECGGHVGPRSSFILWEQACRVLEQAIETGTPPESLSVVFAGGIHDARSAATAAVLAGDLAARGVNIGILMGTAYLFTKEALTTGAIVSRFQDEALRCRRTVLLETGPGHLVRVSPTPFADRFEAERQSLISQGKSHEEIRETLERLNAGRLRLAAKGHDRGHGEGASLVAVSEESQAANGLYMLGQVAALRDRVVTLSELHQEVTAGATALIEQAARSSTEETAGSPNPVAIAIVGMAAVFPGAENVETFWQNSLRGVDAITEVPPDRWDWRTYYDPDPKAPDKIYSKWGGFVPEIPFDPLRYGMPPSSLPSIEPAQLLALEVARTALEDAGYAQRPFPRERTAVVLGMGGGAAQVAMGYAFRSYLPMLDSVSPGAGKTAMEACSGLLPEWTEDSFPGFLLNVTAGRIANRLDLGGANYAVDAACGSSLAALSLGIRELTTGTADMVVLGGVDTVQNPFTYLAFSKTQAFSPRGRCRPFDSGADGIVISEGVAAVILKRLADAQRDGDRIYSVIQGVGASSDGRCRGLTAPSFEGQVRALERAYAQAGIDPGTVGYIEAHGTGTAVGDVVEIEALTQLFQRAGAGPGRCVVGSVKSQIGHTKCAAGLAGLIHASLALHHRVLPPTIGIEMPNPNLDLQSGPFRLNTEARPWLHAASMDHPRRAGVSAFGFGGTNFHVVLEAYQSDPLGRAESAIRDWPAELLAWSAPDRAALLLRLEGLAEQLAHGARVPLRKLACTLATEFRRSGSEPTLAIVATSLDDLSAKLETAREHIATGKTELVDPRGVVYAENPAFFRSKVAFLFPGQGSQAVGMLAELAVFFDDVRDAYEQFDAVLLARSAEPIGPYVFPPPAFDDQTRRLQAQTLQATEVAQPAIGAANVGLSRLLSRLGLTADLVAGHSYGELVALYEAGALDIAGLAELSAIRGRLLRDAVGAHPGAMAALLAGPEMTTELIAGEPSVLAVNLNGPGQTVVAGEREAVDSVLERARSKDIRGRLLPVACAFHTPRMAPACEPLARMAAERLIKPPDRPVFSNLDAAVHPADTVAIARRLGVHVTSPVRLAEMIAAMYDQGARVFVEVGPGGVLTSLVDSILGDRKHLAVACDAPGRPGLSGLLWALAQLLVAGLPIRIANLSRGRSDGLLDLAALAGGENSASLAPSTWMVNGSRSRPLASPEPRRLGQDPPLPVSEVQPDQHTFEPRRVTVMREPKPPSAGHASNGKPRTGTVSTPVLSPDSPPAGAERVLTAFQETMRNFLEVQRATMLAYLAGRPSEPRFERTEATESTPAASSQSQARTTPALSPIPAPAQDPALFAAPPISNAKPVTPARPTREAIAGELLRIVRDRTGYPLEVLKLELDVEADLGIDSIKRVEILGKLRDTLPGLSQASQADAMETLARAKTLGAIVDRVERIVSEPSRPTAPSPAPAVNRDSSRAAEAGSSSGRLRRMLLKAVDAPPQAETASLMPGGTVLVTDDSRGIALIIAQGLSANGIPARLIGGPDSGMDWSSPAAIEHELSQARAQGPIAGLIHALPLRSASDPGLDSAAWGDRIAEEVRGLFLLAKGLAADLEAAAGSGGACLISATAMGGAFASVDKPPAGAFAGHGAIAGIVKTLAREWPDIRARVVDLDGGISPRHAAEHLLAEAFLEDAWTEVGYRDEQRIRLRAISVPLPKEDGGFALGPDDPVVITGGARGITALVAIEMARRWQPTLLLIGTTPYEPSTDQSWLDGVSSASELKSKLYERLSRQGHAVSPSELERAYQSVRRSREVSRSLDQMRAAGARVEYAQADVRDQAGVARVLEQWRRRFGEPVGLIHGAGLIKDKLIRDKSLDAFDRVLSTKLDGALNLVHCLRPEYLRFAVFFSSIAGRFGNAGQSDYAAANEAMNKLAIQLDLRWPGRVLAPIWGPWSGIGMVSDLERHLGAQGLGTIAPEVGVAALMDEFTRGRKGEVEVVLAGDLGTLEAPMQRLRQRLEVSR
jgi:acyl transferase domain-containing protein/NAD(P)H-dependent flavin oxidoreductase YrpB (nitropropane dioxygenase family)